MTREQIVLLALVGLALVCLVLLVAVVRVRASARRSAGELAVVRRRLEELEQRSGGPEVSGPKPPGPVEFVITDLGQPEPVPPPVRPDAPTFADIVLKETVVKAASLAHGVRRGLAPETRNRIRFEMRREVRRLRKQRRADLKEARRDLQARQRVDLAVDTGFDRSLDRGKAS